MLHSIDVEAVDQAKVRETPKRTEFCLSSSVRASATPHSSASRKQTLACRLFCVCYLQPSAGVQHISDPPATLQPLRARGYHEHTHCERGLSDSLLAYAKGSV